MGGGLNQNCFCPSQRKASIASGASHWNIKEFETPANMTD